MAATYEEYMEAFRILGLTSDPIVTLDAYGREIRREFVDVGMAPGTARRGVKATVWVNLPDHAAAGACHHVFSTEVD